MPETASDQLFDDSAVVGTGRLLGDWPITAPTLVEVPATDKPATSPQTETLPLDNDEMRQVA